MALLDSKTRFFLYGAGLGAGVIVAAPFIAPVASAVLRPLAKGVIKQGYLAAYLAGEGLLRAQESLSDLLAEVHSEVEQELKARSGEGATGAETAAGSTSSDGPQNGARAGAAES